MRLKEFLSSESKTNVFDEVRRYILDLGFLVSGYDDSRPWGGFFYVDESQAEQFIHTFFDHLTIEDFDRFSKLSPKILVVAPNQRLSWQYHHRRAEIWKLIGGSAAIVTSYTDEIKPQIDLEIGEVVILQKGERHRLVGTETWGIVAEIWQHTDSENPSDEEDIVRVQDDFGR